MMVRTRVGVTLAVLAGLVLFIGGNWRFAHLAFLSHPGCATIDPTLPAASPDC